MPNRYEPVIDSLSSASNPQAEMESYSHGEYVYIYELEKELLKITKSRSVKKDLKAYIKELMSRA